jgi:hypothetical protein
VVASNTAITAMYNNLAEWRPMGFLMNDKRRTGF